MAKASDYFLSLDDKSKQRFKIKTNNMQRYDPYQTKKEVNHFLFPLKSTD